MARKGSTIWQEELSPQADELAREEMGDQRLLDLDAEEESPFLRGQKRVSARRSALPKKAATSLTWIALAAAAVFLAGAVVAAVYHYGEHSWRFRVDSSDNIEIAGLHNVTRQQVMEVMGGDIGRNIFFIPLAERQRQLQQIAWVESASVMRFVPNRLRIELHERTPAAFARVGSKIFLIDSGGTLMDLPAASKRKYSFPVIVGMNTNEPQSSREARMKIYNELARELDSGGAHYTQDLSEVDLSDGDDVKVMANDPAGPVLVHLGSSDFLERYKVFVSHVREWRQQFARLDSVDLRYDNQIVVNPDVRGAVPPPVLSAAEKPAALITKEGTTVKTSAKNSAQPAVAKAHRHKAAVKPLKTQVKPAAAPGAQLPAQAPQNSPAKPAAAVQIPAQEDTASASSGKPSPAIPKGP